VLTPKPSPDLRTLILRCPLTGIYDSRPSITDRPRLKPISPCCAREMRLSVPAPYSSTMLAASSHLPWRAVPGRAPGHVCLPAPRIASHLRQHQPCQKGFNPHCCPSSTPSLPSPIRSVNTTDRLSSSARTRTRKQSCSERSAAWGQPWALSPAETNPVIKTLSCGHFHLRCKCRCHQGRGRLPAPDTRWIRSTHPGTFWTRL